MILGWSMGVPSVCGRAGIGIRDCIWKDLESRLASVLELASLAGSVGDGTIGDMTGIITTFASTTTTTNLTAESLSIVTTSIMPVDFTAAIRVSTGPRSMDSRERMPRAGYTLEPSAALTMAEPPEVFPRVDNPASVEDSMEVVSTGVAAVAFMAAEDTGDSVHFCRRKLRYGEQDHAHCKCETRDSSWKVC
jgi:hypothetical protein